MKKSLLLISLCFCTCFTFCQNNPKKQTIKEKPVTNNQCPNNDKKNTIAKSVNDKGVKKDTTEKKNKSHAIIHGEQNQAKTDSIKKAKTKGKK